MTKQFYENYWNRQSDYLSDFPLKWPKLKKFIPIDDNITIIDFGCGNGKILEEIKKINPKAKLIGLDVSEIALKEAERNLPEVEFYKIVDGEKFSLNDRIADFIFSSEVIEHIYDTENAFMEMARILKPNGKILLTTPYHGVIKNLLIIIFDFNTHFNPVGAHIRFFTKKTLLGLLNKNNLKLIKIGYYGRFWPINHSFFVLAEKI